MLTLTALFQDEPAAWSARPTLSRVFLTWASKSSGVLPVSGSEPVWPAVQTSSPTRTAGLRIGDGLRPGTVMTSLGILLLLCAWLGTAVHSSSVGAGPSFGNCPIGP